MKEKVYEWDNSKKKKVSTILHAPDEYHRNLKCTPKGTLRRGAIGKRKYVPYAVVATTNTRKEAGIIMESLRDRRLGVYAQHFPSLVGETFGINGELLPNFPNAVAVYCKTLSGWEWVRSRLNSLEGLPFLADTSVILNRESRKIAGIQRAKRSRNARKKRESALDKKIKAAFKRLSTLMKERYG